MSLPARGESSHPLRLGVCCGGGAIEDWAVAAIEQVVAQGLASVVLVIDLKSSAPGKPPSDRAGTPARWLARRFGRRASPYNAVPLLSKASRVSMEERSPSSAGDIVAHELDIILGFADRRSLSELTGTSRLGVWTFLVGFGDARELVSSCFSAFCAGQRTIDAALVCIVDDDHYEKLKDGCIGLVPYSLSRSIGLVVREIAKWPSYAIRAMPHLLTSSRAIQEFENKRRPLRASSSTIVAYAAKTVGNIAHHALDLFLDDNWDVGVVDVPVSQLVTTLELPRVKWFPNHERGRFLADPVGAVASNDLVTVLCETCELQKGEAGNIGSIVLERGAWQASICSAMPISCHASYPFVLQRNSEIYCIPETYQAGEVRLYRAVDFPRQWVLERVLITGVRLVDSTIWYQNGYWWLFCGDVDDGHQYKLQLWFAADICGIWQPHPLNPVKIDVRSSRPAGPLFSHEGIVYRPAQDYSAGHSARIAMNRVLTLDPTAFAEECIGFIGPPKDGAFRDGVHSLCPCGNRTLIDGKSRVLTQSGVRRFLGALTKLLSTGAP